jgi:hypothetical protein
MTRLFLILLGIVLAGTAIAAGNAPPSGNNMPVQAAKTGSYQIKSTDLKTMIPFNCSAPCTVTVPQSTSSWPKGYPVIIQSIGSATVTIHPTSPSTIYGISTTGGDVLLTTSGNWASLTADSANNYLAYGNLGSGGGGSMILLTCGTSLCTCGTSLCTQ